MNLTDEQHCKWFVASLLPHLRVALSQQKIGTEAKALEIMMKLHETPMQEANLGAQQIHAQLQYLCLEMQCLKNDRTTQPKACKEVWWIKCKSEGHDKDHSPIFINYVAVGGLMPLRLEDVARPSTGPTLWCGICSVVGKHVKENFHLLQEFIQTPQHLLCKFYQLMGHDEHNCRSYKLMIDRTPTYGVQEETRSLGQGTRGARGEYQGNG